MRARRLLQDELGDFAALLRTLEPAQWELASLCVGWSVRDVVAHVVAWDGLLAAGWVRGVPRLAARSVRAGFSTARLNAHLLAAFRERATGELVTAMERLGDDGKRSFDRLSPGSQLAELVVHHQDIRRSLRQLRAIPDERLRVALDAVGRLPGVPAARRARGLQLRATDLDWTRGRGPLVEGPGEALLLALAGRPAALDDLAGVGLSELAERVR